MPYKDPKKQKEAQAKWYRDNHAQLRSKMNKRQLQRRNAAKKWIDQYKTDHPTCTDCKLDYPPHILDFDHLRDKTAGLARLVRDAASIEVLKAEIDKCEIVCSNCHRHRTWERSVKVT